MIKAKKNNRKRQAEETNSENNVESDDVKPKKKPTRAKKSINEEQATEINEKKQNVKPAAMIKANQDNNRRPKVADVGSEKKGGEVTPQKKPCRPKPLAFIPFENDAIPEAHLSLRQSEDDNPAKQRQSKKNSRPNALILTVISDINITLKPHDAYLFKLNGYLHSLSKNVFINLFSEPQISSPRDLCALNWMVGYNDDKAELIVPIYNRGNKTQWIQANEPVAIIRAWSPESKLVLKQ